MEMFRIWHNCIRKIGYYWLCVNCSGLPKKVKTREVCTNGQTQTHMTIAKCGSKRRQIVKNQLSINQRYELCYDLYGQNSWEYKSVSEFSYPYKNYQQSLNKK